MKPFEYLFLRDIKFDYVCPPICEAFFSSTGEPTILLETHVQAQVKGLEFTWDGEEFRIQWTAYPGALCYSIYRVEGDPPSYTLVAECVDEVVVPDDGGCYAVTAISSDGESSPSDVICPDVDTCPQWVSTPSANTPVLCGEPLTISAEANVPAVPGAVLTYTWTLASDPDDVIFSETKSGESTLTVESAQDVNAGEYVVRVTYLDCSLTDAVVVEVIGCGGGGSCGDAGAMPASFMEADDTTITEESGGLALAYDWTALVLDPGDYRLEWLSGFTDECVYPDYGLPCHSNTSPYHPEFCDGPCKAHSQIYKIDGKVQWQDDSSTWHDVTEEIAASAFQFAVGTDCWDCPEPCFNCNTLQAPLTEQQLVDAVELNYGPSHSTESDHSGDPFQRVPWDAFTPGGGTKPGRISAGAFFTGVAGIGTNLGNQFWQLGTGTVTFRLKRIKKFIDQPWGVYIVDFVNVMNAIKPPDQADPSMPTPAWNGIFDQSADVTENLVNYSLYGNPPAPDDLWYEFVDITDSTVSGDTNLGYWQLNLLAWYFNGVGWFSRTLWRGKKTGGNTAVGFYTKELAYVDGIGGSAPTCIGISA